jgi:hypothetical protein
MRARTLVISTAALTLAASAYLGTSGASASPSGNPNVFAHLSGSLQQLLANGFPGAGGGSLPKSTCQTSGDPAANIDVNCDEPIGPDNETPIVADPANPNHLLAGSNDYFFKFTGSTFQERVPTGFFTSFDGGKTWIDGQVPMGNGGSGGNGDPSPAFNDKFGLAAMGQLSAAQGQSGPNAGHIDVSVSVSPDGGINWKPPTTVDIGQASIGPSANAVFLDKEWLSVDNNPSSPFYGRMYLSYDKLSFSKGAFLDSPVLLSFSDDGGKSWSTPRAISGQNPTYCTVNQGTRGAPPLCDESFFSYSGVEPNGDVVVGFMNQQHQAAWEVPNEFEDQILVVRSTDGGRTWSDPVHVADLEDGGIEGIVFSDYPASVDGRATQTGHQFRTGSWGNLAVDPVTGAVYVVWTDNRDGAHDVANPVTDTNVFMAKSTNEGQTWSGVIRVTSGPADKWFPWVTARAGTVEALFMDGTYDWPSRNQYGITLATSANGGTSWSQQQVSTALSNPNTSVWFPARVTGCETCSRFIGDYIGAAIDTLGRTHMTWTDMRRNLSVPELNRTGKAEDTEYARR